MALGTVLFSLPTALLFALYGVAAEGASVSQGLLVYAAMGTAILVSFTVLHGLKLEDFQ